MAINEDGEILASTSVALPHTTEQVPRHWWQATLSVLGKLTAELVSHTPVALSVDGTSATLLLCDAANNPVSPPLMYNDSRAREQATRLLAIAPENAPVHSPTSSLAKLLWLLDNISIAKGAYATHQAEWILTQLSGTRLPGDENNCLKLGYDPISRTWPDWISNLGIPENILPEVVPAGTCVSTISPDIATSTGLPISCVLIAGTTDSTAAALATGISNPGEAVTSLGSTLVLKILADQPLFSSKQGIYSHRILNHWLVGGASNSGGAVLQHYFSDQEMVALTPKLDPAHLTGLEYYPLLTPGERFPYNNPDHPINIAPVPNQRVKFFQGLLEGIASIEQTGYQLLQAMGAPAASKVITMGGGSINTAWQTIRAQKLGIAVTIAKHTEAAYGSALLSQKGYQDRAL